VSGPFYFERGIHVGALAVKVARAWKAGDRDGARLDLDGRRGDFFRRGLHRGPEDDQAEREQKGCACRSHVLMPSETHLCLWSTPASVRRSAHSRSARTWEELAGR